MATFGFHLVSMTLTLKFIKIWERDCRAHTHKYSVVKLIKFGIFKKSLGKWMTLTSAPSTFSSSTLFLVLSKFSNWKILA